MGYLGGEYLKVIILNSKDSPHISGVFCLWDDGYGISFVSDTFFKLKK